MNKKKLISN